MKKIKHIKRPWEEKGIASSWKDKKEYNKFYTSRIWRKTREVYLSLHPFCEQCLMQNKFVAAKVVDHIIPLDQRNIYNSRFHPLDMSNMQALCKPCHERKSGSKNKIYVKEKL